MACKIPTLRSIVVLFILQFILTSCTHVPPRVDESGASERDYTYQAPLQINDGWQVSSLAEEGVSEEIINVSVYLNPRGRVLGDGGHFDPVGEQLQVI